jgi:hypothetical protein
VSARERGEVKLLQVAAVRERVGGIADIPVDDGFYLGEHGRGICAWRELDIGITSLGTGPIVLLPGPEHFVRLRCVRQNQVGHELGVVGQVFQYPRDRERMSGDAAVFLPAVSFLYRQGLTEGVAVAEVFPCGALG